MNYTYPVTITKDNEGDFVVNSREFPELVTSGGSLAEALDLAADALEVVLLTYVERGWHLPDMRPAAEGEYDVPVSIG